MFPFLCVAECLEPMDEEIREHPLQGGTSSTFQQNPAQVLTAHLWKVVYGITKTWWQIFCYLCIFSYHKVERFAWGKGIILVLISLSRKWGLYWPNQMVWEGPIQVLKQWVSKDQQRRSFCWVTSPQVRLHDRLFSLTDHASLKIFTFY